MGGGTSPSRPSKSRPRASGATPENLVENRKKTVLSEATSGASMSVIDRETDRYIHGCEKYRCLTLNESGHTHKKYQ